MKYDKEEKELIKTIEKDEWRTVRNYNISKGKMQNAARSTMLKDQRMNVRIAKRDLDSLKAKALEEGIPYQTLVASVLHKYVAGRLIEKES
jgi:predicted DNA binding CopG/RHH family protein